MDLGKERAQIIKLNTTTRQVLWLCAVADRIFGRRELHDFAQRFGWSVKKGKKILAKDISAIVDDLLEKNFLAGSSYNSVVINEKIQDLATQDAIENDAFQYLIEGIREKYEWPISSNSERYEQRSAFYKGDVDAFFKTVSSRKTYSHLNLLHPFNKDIFGRLPDALKKWYVIDTTPRALTFCDKNTDFWDVFNVLLSETDTLDAPFIATVLDAGLGRGDLRLLNLLDERTNRKHPEIRACVSLLKGDTATFMEMLQPMMPGGNRRGKPGTAYRLPGLFIVLNLLAQGTGDALIHAETIFNAATNYQGRYVDPMQSVKIGLDFKQSPSQVSLFVMRLKHCCISSLSTLVAGYIAAWCLTPKDGKLEQKALLDAAKAFEAQHLDWFAAEMFGLAGRLFPVANKQYAEKSRGIHDRLGTGSIVSLAVAVPPWRRSLDAIVELAGGGEVNMDAETTAGERLIWEWDPKYGPSELVPIQQKKSRGGWTKGRKVALSRLYENFTNAFQFGFLTEQDVAICRSMEAYVTRNYSYYPETHYTFNERDAALALIDHPRVFLPGERDIPLEIKKKTPQLKITRSKKGDITLSMDPQPKEPLSAYDICVESERRVSIVLFSDRQLALGKLLDGKLKAPAGAVDEVMASAQRIASIIPVHSELDAVSSETTSTGEQVIADTSLHVHFSPIKDGLQAEFFVYPFDNQPLMYSPGQGGANVFANIDGQPTVAIRNLKKEIQKKDALLAACPILTTYAETDTLFYMPTATAALDVLLELEPLADKKQALLHWPKGKSLSLVGQVSINRLQLNIRKDKDMFAASGKLTVNPSLTLDLLQLVDLLKSSPSRYVELEKGRFVALTDALRQYIEALSLYGNRHTAKNSLLFPKSRAVMLDTEGADVKVRTDKYWKEWKAQISEAGALQIPIPSTLQTELRDYQKDGFVWMARLAELGAGALLADDMGLGKTIQALALLLHRAAAGPSLVVAPTSVADNWKTEIERFAPTLNVHMFRDGNRVAQLKSAAEFDVFVCSYGLLLTESKRLGGMHWATVILDEAQYIKNEATKRSQAAKGLKADFRLTMTGTPVENHPGELWNLFDFVNPGLLGSAQSFQERFIAPIEVDNCKWTRQRLKQLIQPYLLRRTKAQVLEELPDRTEIVRKVVLTAEEAALYEALRQKAMEKLNSTDEGSPGHIQILAELMRLRRACCHPRLIIADWNMPAAKLELFVEIVDELVANHHKVLVFSQFVDHLAILKTEIEKCNISYQYLDGSTPAHKRKECIDAFQAGNGDVFFISLKAGGLGLNLTAADYVIHMDPWWNPAVEDQASDRAHRMGQKRPVTIYRFITQGTVEEKIQELHKEKRALADSLLEGADVSGKLSAKELLELIRA